MSLPNELLKVFKDYKNYPILENVKSEDSIDYIKPDQMSHSLMKGIDNNRRTFIAIKIFPREIYDQMLISQYENHESCLTLVALSRNHYLPPDIARYIQEFLEYRPTYAKYYGSSSSDENLNNTHPISLKWRKKYLEHQIVVHTFFQKYTTSPQGCGSYFHGWNSYCYYTDHYRHDTMFNMEVRILNSTGEWNTGWETSSKDPKSELEKLLDSKHPKAMIYNKEIEQMISCQYPPRPLINEK